MFDRPTVFILGAGASWHYGYPTGEKLVGDVMKEAAELAGHCERWGSYGQFITDFHLENRSFKALNTVISSAISLALDLTADDQCCPISHQCHL